mgnify:CR=1 FL=1
MLQGTKVATCCYCGTRAALVLRGKTRHELSCSACGAPLHDLKIMPMSGSDRPARNTSRRAPPVPHDVVRPMHKDARKADKSARKYKKKSRMRHFLGEAFDLIEDIFD